MRRCFEVKRRAWVVLFGPLGYGEGVGDGASGGQQNGRERVDLFALRGCGWWGGAEIKVLVVFGVSSYVSTGRTWTSE